VSLHAADSTFDADFEFSIINSQFSIIPGEGIAIDSAGNT